MTEQRKPRQPARLGAAGKKLWTSLVDTFDFDAREVAVLERACRQCDDVALLEGLLERDGLSTVGSTGQPKLTPIVSELRQGRLAVARLLGDLALPDGSQMPATARTVRARKAANHRWTQKAEREERHLGALP